MVTPHRLLALIVLSAPLLQSCADIDENVKKTVWMKYVHVANVQTIQVDGNLLRGIDPNSFWAIFDICSIDLQGSALTGFSYNASNFFVAAGSVNYGPPPNNDGYVAGNWGSNSLPSQDPKVTTPVRHAFSLSVPTHYFQKSPTFNPLYSNLNYRIAIFVKEHPPGYNGTPMQLKYNGQPQVAAVLQDVTPSPVEFRDNFLSPGAPPFIGKCPT
jgi:hypothetical protein